MPDLDDIRAFAEVADSGSLTRAGARLGMSKSMISRRLARLEARARRAAPRADHPRHVADRGGRATSGPTPSAWWPSCSRRATRSAARARRPAGCGWPRRSPSATRTSRRCSPSSRCATRSSRSAPPTATGVVDLVGEGFDAAVRLGNLRRLEPDRAADRAAARACWSRAPPTWRAPERRGPRPISPGTRPSRTATRSGSSAATARRFTYRPRGRFTADSGPAELAGVVAGLGIAAMPAFLAGPAIERGELVIAARRLRDPAGGHLRRAAAAGRAGADEGQGADRHHAGEVRRRRLGRLRAPRRLTPQGMERPDAPRTLDWPALGLGIAFALIWSSAFTSSRIVVEYWPPFLVLTVHSCSRGRSRSRSGSPRGSGSG